MNLVKICLQVTSLVKGAIGKRLLVSLESLENLELLNFVRQHLGLEFWLSLPTVDKLNQVAAFVCWNQGFFL